MEKHLLIVTSMSCTLQVSKRSSSHVIADASITVGRVSILQFKILAVLLDGSVTVGALTLAF